MLGILSLMAGACSTGGVAEQAEGNVRTADAATASARRSGGDGRGSDEADSGSADADDGDTGAVQDRGGLTDGGQPDAGGGGNDGGGAPEDGEPVDGADDARPTPPGSRTDGPSADDDGPTPGPSSYPPITGPIGPAGGGVQAMLSPSGVLVTVTGRTGQGYVVETPCGGVTELAWGQPVTGVQVMLDPGHGGDERGAESAIGLTEAELNLALARRAAAELTGRSIVTVLSRNADYRIPIRRRAALADAVGPEVLVSIHHNTPASRPSPQPGTEVYVQQASDRSKRLGGLLYEEVVETLDRFDVEWTSRDDAGVLTVIDDDGEDAYGIARYPATTSALIEMAYLGNDKEAVLLATPDYLDAAGTALADAIERFLTTDDPGTGFVERPRVFNPSGATGGVGGCNDPPLQ